MERSWRYLATFPLEKFLQGLAEKAPSCWKCIQGRSQLWALMWCKSWRSRELSTTSIQTLHVTGTQITLAWTANPAWHSWGCRPVQRDCGLASGWASSAKQWRPQLLTPGEKLTDLIRWRAHGGAVLCSPPCEGPQLASQTLTNDARPRLPASSSGSSTLASACQSPTGYSSSVVMQEGR